MDAPLSTAVIGTGPAGLMAADCLRRAGRRVTLIDQGKGLGRKLLIAGSSGLNISNALPVAEFESHYAMPRERAAAMLRAFPPAAWLDFIQSELKLETFRGTSDRYFVREMKAAGLVKRWTERLKALGVEIRLGHTWLDFGGSVGEMVFQGPDQQTYTERFSAVVLALGGGSYLPVDRPAAWVETFRRRGIPVADFRPSNVGYQVAWKAEFLREADRQPLKNVVLRTGRGEKAGELLVTAYGLEGTPVYTVGQSGPAWLDLKPDWSEAEVQRRLQEVRENLSPLRRAKKKLGLSETALALLFHHAPAAARERVEEFAKIVKAFPLALGSPQPLAEAISSSGGVAFAALNAQGALRTYPWVFPVGEMLDWDAPTGGFLIQACVAQGVQAAEAIRRLG